MWKSKALLCHTSFKIIAKSSNRCLSSFDPSNCANNNILKHSKILLLDRNAFLRHCSNVKGRAAFVRQKESNNLSPMGYFLLLIPVATFGLGCWQVRRKAWKERLVADLNRQTKLDAVPLPENLDDLSHMEYQKVQVQGKFLHDKELLMGPRSFIRPDGSETGGGLISQRDGSNGYLIITPFQLSNRDDIILINRGWVPRNQLNPENRIEGQIDKEIMLTGVVRNAEARPQFSPDHKSGAFLYRDLTKMCAITGASPIFLDATHETTVPGGPIGGQTRISLRNEHLSYLITWYSLSAATAYLWYRQFIKRKPF